MERTKTLLNYIIENPLRYDFNGVLLYRIRHLSIRRRRYLTITSIPSCNDQSVTELPKERPHASTDKSLNYIDSGPTEMITNITTTLSADKVVDETSLNNRSIVDQDQVL